jgi:hypothetical protein
MITSSTGLIFKYAIFLGLQLSDQGTGFNIKLKTPCSLHVEVLLVTKKTLYSK